MIPIKKQVRSIRFHLLGPEEIKKLATAKIITPELYDVDGYPVDGGLMDLRLGAIDPGVRCRTCGGTLKECLGHSGYIELARPVIHLKYAPQIEMLLKGCCDICGRILISEEDIKKYPLKERIKKAKSAKKCFHCGAEKEKIKIEKPTSFFVGKKRIFPTEIRERLERIPDEDLKYFAINSKVFRPEKTILTLMLVPPVTIRPSITLESGERSEDDLTHKLGDIVRANQRLWENLNAGAPEVIVEDLWDLLQYHVTTFFDNNVAGIPPARHRSGQPLKTITERIKGKEGRIRHNLTGKRVNYSARTVISPDPSIKIEEVGVPYEIAKIVTVPEMVNSMNIEKLKKIILSPDYPSANYVIRPDGKRKKITPELKEEILEEIENGYIVERHLIDGDIVLFNRQPSLHRASLMAHEVRVLPYKTFRINPAVNFPYNADFDGDEMNLHSPQNNEAIAESRVLLHVKNNLISPTNNVNLFGCVQDALTGNYILTSKEISRGEAMQLIYKSKMEEKLSKKKISGKEILSLFIPKLDFEAKTKGCLGLECSYHSKCKKEKCPNNAYAKIEKGNLISGIIDKGILGVEDAALLKLIDRQYGRDEAIKFLNKSFTLGIEYLSRNGFSIGLKDFEMGEKLMEESKKLVEDTERKTEEIIDSFYKNELEIIPGKSREETREIKTLQTLNEVRTKIGRLVKSNINKTNPLTVSINSGAGGNLLNCIQIACCIGQQSLWGERIKIGYNNRTLSFFKEGDLSPKSKGFIYSSYLKGTNPIEFFFGAMTGRDSLMDTALRTPKSGYLYRRLTNSLQDFKVAYDGTIRDASENIVEFKYGDDGKDVSSLHKNEQISPGEPIGVVVAQSFGEPATQMTLNTFHLSGVQEMQVTQGLPRIIEIFDARKTPSTPQMEIYLDSEHNNEKNAKIVAEKIKEVKLSDIMAEIKIDFGENKIEVEINRDSLKGVHITMETLAERLKEKGFKIKFKDKTIYATNLKLNYKEIYKLKEKLKNSVISGVKGISEVLIVKRERNFIILTSGSNLEEVLKQKGVSQDKTKTNNIFEMEKIFGIEAARKAIIEEVKKVINQQGLDINERHIKLIADAMTYKGTIKGTTRMGIISEKSSILARASFETPIKQFVNSTLKENKDSLNSVIENIILNQPIPIGTGLPGLLVKITGQLTKVKDKKNNETTN